MDREVKADIEEEYSNKLYKGSKTPWLLIGITIALLIVTLISMLVFFYFNNSPPTHQIVIVNNCNEDITAMLGVINSKDDIDFFSNIRLSPKQEHHYRATPGVSILVQGYKNGDTILLEGLNPFTTVELTLAGKGFTKERYVTDGNNRVVDVKSNDNEQDYSNISLQGGYNMPITIKSTNNPSCNGPKWNHPIDGNNCPEALRSNDDQGNFQVCLSPCTALDTADYCCTKPGVCDMSNGCQSTWQDINYYNVFSEACPKCLITNCGSNKITCTSQGKLNQYTIALCL